MGTATHDFLSRAADALESAKAPKPLVAWNLAWFMTQPGERNVHHDSLNIYTGGRSPGAHLILPSTLLHNVFSPPHLASSHNTTGAENIRLGSRGSSAVNIIDHLCLGFSFHLRDRPRPKDVLLATEQLRCLRTPTQNSELAVLASSIHHRAHQTPTRNL
jgi:hypothetical protein